MAKAKGSKVSGSGTFSKQRCEAKLRNVETADQRLAAMREESEVLVFIGSRDGTGVMVSQSALSRLLQDCRNMWWSRWEAAPDEGGSDTDS